MLTLHGDVNAADFGAEEMSAFASAIASSVSYCTDAREVKVLRVTDYVGFDDDGGGVVNATDDRNNATDDNKMARARRLWEPQRQASWLRRAAGIVSAATYAAWNALVPHTLEWPTADDNAAASLHRGRVLASSATQDVHVNFTLEIPLESSGFAGLATDFSTALLAEVTRAFRSHHAFNDSFAYHLALHAEVRVSRDGSVTYQTAWASEEA